MRMLAVVAFFLPPFAFGQTFTIVPGGALHTPQDSAVIWFKINGTDGIPVTDVTEDRIRIREGGNVVTDFAFSRTSPPQSEHSYITLLLDASGSMRYQDKMANLRRSALQIVNAMTDMDHCSIIAFSSTARLLTGFTNNKADLKKGIESIDPDGYTAIYDAIWEAANQLASQPDASPKIILLITDGQEEGASLFDLTDIVPKLQSVSNLTLHVFDLNRPNPVNDLRRIARLGNGSYVHDPKPDNVFAAFADFLSENRKAFVVRYQAPSDGGLLRTVTVSVRLKDIEQKFETSYRQIPPAGSGMSAVILLAGFAGACAAGVAGTVVYTKRKRLRSNSLIASRRDPLFVEAPKMVFDVVEGRNGDEKTHALDFDSGPDDEKTIIIETRKKETPVFGHLSVTDINEEKHILDIDAPELLFGRSSQCKARFDNMEVSRLHAKLRLETEGFILYDLGSANGTFVNGEEVQKRLLIDGDEIEIGKNRIVFSAANGFGTSILGPHVGNGHE